MAALAEHYLHSMSLRRSNTPPPEEYPYTLPAVRALLHRLEFHPRCTFLIGENGSGKSTLMEALAVALGLQAEGGSRNFHFKTRDTHTNLWKFLDVARGPLAPNDRYFLRAETFYNLASEIDRLDETSEGGGSVRQFYGGSLHTRSHGESFYALFLNRLGRQGLYLFDEPEAALSPQRQLGLLTRMNDLIKARSQFVIATHSPIVMAYPDAWIYELSEQGIRRVAYEETEHYQVTHMFLQNPTRMLRELFKDADPGKTPPSSPSP